MDVKQRLKVGLLYKLRVAPLFKVFYLAVLPRMLFDRWSGQDYVRLFKEKIRVQELSTVISNVLQVIHFKSSICSLKNNVFHFKRAF